MPVQAAMREIRVRGGDENYRAAARQTAEQGGDEPERGRSVRFGLGHDFVHGGERQAALGQAGIQRRQTKGQNPVRWRDPVLSRHQTA